MAQRGPSSHSSILLLSLLRGTLRCCGSPPCGSAPAIASMLVHRCYARAPIGVTPLVSQQKQVLHTTRRTYHPKVTVQQVVNYTPKHSGSVPFTDSGSPDAGHTWHPVFAGGGGVRLAHIHLHLHLRDGASNLPRVA